MCVCARARARIISLYRVVPCFDARLRLRVGTELAQDLARLALDFREVALVLLFVVTVQTYTLFDKVTGTYNDNVLTFDLRLPTWPFFAVAWIGDVSAVLLIAIRTYRLIFHPDKFSKCRVDRVELFKKQASEVFVVVDAMYRERK